MDAKITELPVKVTQTRTDHAASSNELYMHYQAVAILPTFLLGMLLLRACIAA